MGPQQALQSRGMVDLQNDLELHVSRIQNDSTRVDGFVDEENKSESSMSSESDIDFNLDGAPLKSMEAGGLRKNTDDHDDVSICPQGVAVPEKTSNIKKTLCHQSSKSITNMN